MNESLVQKECVVCKSVLPLKKFPFDPKEGFGDTCKECVKDSEAFKGKVEVKSVVENAVEDFKKENGEDKMGRESVEEKVEKNFVRICVSQEYPPIKGRAKKIFNEHLTPYIQHNGDGFTATEVRKYLWPKWNPNRIHTVLQEVVKAGFISREKDGVRVLYSLTPEGQALLDNPISIDDLLSEDIHSINPNQDMVDPLIHNPLLEKKPMPQCRCTAPELPEVPVEEGKLDLPVELEEELVEVTIKDKVLSIISRLYGKVALIELDEDSLTIQLNEVQDVLSISRLLPEDLQEQVEVSTASVSHLSNEIYDTLVFDIKLEALE